MFQIDVLSRMPIYEQLISQMERFILTGILQKDEQLPSVRNLSLELSVNPNTIQKAYSELDRRGITYVVPGRGCFVAADAAGKIGCYRRSQLDQLVEQLRELVMAGITREELMACVEKAFGKEEAAS